MQNSTLGIHGEFNDIHICGACKTQFSDIQAFVLHKQQNCTALILPNTTNSIGQCNLSILVPDPVNQNTFDGSRDSTIHNDLVPTEQPLTTVELNCRNNQSTSSFSDSTSVAQSNEPGVTTRSRSFLRSGFGKRPSGKPSRPTATVQPQRQRSTRPLQASNILPSETTKQLRSENPSTLCIGSTNFSSNIDFSGADNVHGVPSSSALSASSSSSQQILPNIPLSQTVANPQSIQTNVIHSSTVITPFQTNLIFTPGENNACHSVLSLPPTGDTTQTNQSCLFPSNVSSGNGNIQNSGDSFTSLNVGISHSQQATNITQTCNNIQPDTSSVHLPSEETCNQQLILPTPAAPINNGMFTPATDSPDFFVTNELNVAVSTNGVAEALDNRETESPGITVINEIRKSKNQAKYQIVKTDGVKRYKCEYDSCSYTTPYMKDLDRHFRIHTGERPFLCQKCGKAFNRMDKMRAHEKCHTGVRPYKCNTCPYATRDHSSLVKHLRIHTDERPFKCQICPYAGRSTSQLVVHLRTHTGDAPFHCFVCSAKFKINSDLKRHVRQHTGEKPFKCTLCNYRCSVKVNLTIHNRLNHAIDNQWKCSKCDFSTPSRKKLREHEYIHSNKPVSCPQCTYTTTSKKNLKTHLQIHSGEKPHKCGYCSFSSRQAGNLQTHIKTKHPEKATKRKKFKNNSKNEDEENVDDVSYKPESKGRRKKGSKTSKPACQKTYKCTLCDDSFVREDSLRSHLRHHMKQTCEPVALAMLQLQDSVGNSQVPSQNSCTASSSATTTTTTTTLRSLDTSESVDVVSSTSMNQDQQSVTVSGQNHLDNRAIHNSLPAASPPITNDCSSTTTTSCALISEMNTFPSNSGSVSTSFVSTHSQAGTHRSFNSVASSSNILQHLPGETNEISNIPEESHIVLNISPPMSVADNNFHSQDISHEQQPEEERENFNLGNNNSIHGGNYLPTSVSSSVCNEVAAASSTSNSQQGNSISRTEAATLLARIQNHANLAREDNLHNTSVASNSLPPDLVAMPISSLLPITTTTQSQTVSWVPPVQVSPAVQTGVVPSLSATVSNPTSSASQPAVENAPQLMYPLQSGMGIIAIPVVSLNPNAVETDSVLGNNNNIPKAPISAIRSQNSVVSIPHSATFIAPPPQTLVQFSGLQSNIQYILQPPAPPQAPSAIRLEVAGIQLSLGNNAVITSCPEPTVPSPTISSLSSPRVLTTGPSTGMGDLTFLLGGNNSTDASQQINNLTMPIVADNTLNGTVLPTQNTFSKFVLGAVQGLPAGANAAFNTPTQISQETLSNVIYPSLASTSRTNGEPKTIPLMVSPVYSIPDSASASLSGQGSSHQQ